jgi:hypothetical protein
MLSPQALIKGLVQRALPSSPNPDSANTDIALRQFSYGEVVTQPLIRREHNLADEGSYFVINNNQTGITPPLVTAFAATTPALIIYNNSSLRLGLLYINLMNLVAVTCTAGTAGQLDLSAALVIDNGNRYSSAGTVLPGAISPNMASGTAAGSITAYFGALVATAATGAVRTVIGQRMIRPLPVAAAMTVVGDTFQFNFGAVENACGSSITIANANIIPVPCPPVVIGPNQSMLLYLWWAALTPAGGAAGFLPELGFSLR